MVALGALYYNPNMLRSDRFGGNKSIVGMLFIFALFGSIIKSSMCTRGEAEESRAKKLNKQLMRNKLATERAV